MTDFAAVFTSGHFQQGFLAKPFYDPQVRISQTQSASNRLRAPELIPLLIEQNSNLPESPARSRALKDATSGEVAFVITGQQTGLFLGPLLTLYKALSAIVVAQKLQSDTGIRTIPLFWLQSEDHDFDEINHCLLPDAAGNHQHLTLSERSSPPRTSVHYEVIRDSREAALSQLNTVMESLPNGAAVSKLITSAYRNCDSVVSAFAVAFAALLRDEELLFFNSRDRRIATLAAPIYRRALSDHETISQILLNREQELHQAGFESQVHIRANSPLFFFHPESENGERYRLLRHGAKWQLIGTDKFVTDQELATALENNPLQFSSSALLRPIVQEYLFPSAGYVGGTAELNYFAQVDPLFDYFSIPRPVVYPRASFRCSEPKTRRLLEKLNLSGTSSSLAEELKHQVASVQETAAFDAIASRLREEFDNLVNEMRRVDPTLMGPTQKTGEKLFKQLASLREKYSEALARSNITDQERIQWLNNMLFPEGVEQERLFSPLYFLAKYGFEFVTTVKNAIDPFNPIMREIQL